MDLRLAALLIDLERPQRDAEVEHRRLMAEFGRTGRQERALLRWAGRVLVGFGTRLETAAGAAPRQRQARTLSG